MKHDFDGAKLPSKKFPLEPIIIKSFIQAIVIVSIFAIYHFILIQPSPVHQDDASANSDKISTQNESVQDKSTQNESVQNESVQNESTQYESTQKRNNNDRQNLTNSTTPLSNSKDAQSDRSNLPKKYFNCEDKINLDHFSSFFDDDNWCLKNEGIFKRDNCTADAAYYKFLILDNPQSTEGICLKDTKITDIQRLILTPDKLKKELLAKNDDIDYIHRAILEELKQNLVPLDQPNNNSKVCHRYQISGKICQEAADNLYKTIDEFKTTKTKTTQEIEKTIKEQETTLNRYCKCTLIQ